MYLYYITRQGQYILGPFGTLESAVKGKTKLIAPIQELCKIVRTLVEVKGIE